MGWLSKIGGGLGTVVGGLVGGPLGARVGGTLGSVAGRVGGVVARNPVATAVGVGSVLATGAAISGGAAGSNVVAQHGPAPKGMRYSIGRYNGVVRLVKNRRHSKMPTLREREQFQEAMDILKGFPDARRALGRRFARKFRI